MVMLHSRRLNLKGLTPSQYRVLNLLSEGGVKSLSFVTRMVDVDTSLIIGQGSNVGSGFRHSLLSLGFVAERGQGISITDSGREFLSGLSL